MNFFNKITDFLFPKKEEPTQFSLTDEELLDLLSELLTNYRHDYIVGYLGGYYLSGCNKNETEQRIKKLKETLAKYQEEENSLLRNNRFGVTMSLKLAQDMLDLVQQTGLSSGEN